MPARRIVAGNAESGFRSHELYSGYTGYLFERGNVPEGRSAPGQDFVLCPRAGLSSCNKVTACQTCRENAGINRSFPLSCICGFGSGHGSGTGPESGYGMAGQNNLLLCRQGGSFFFLGEMLVDLPLPVDPEEKSHCGNCERCFRHCPTNAIVESNLVDARRCISYLTIELKGTIPVELRPLIGNRIYGCDDCQLVCPWNRFAERAKISDFNVRHGFDRSGLLDLFSWTETEFYEKTEGSAIRRIGYDRWIRNIAVALGNALRDMENESVRDAIVHALNEKKSTVSEMVDEHIVWALH